jgi:urease accessory protein
MRNLLFVLFALGSGPVWAHPGHGQHAHDGFSLIHYLSEPDHVAAIVLVVVLIAGLAGWWWQRNKVR